jgi:putative NADPH-quinone reductase
MDPQRIVLIQGHPDATAPHLCHALAHSYADGATHAGHEVRQVDIATIDFPWLRSQHEWELGLLPASLKPAQADIRWAQHIVLFFPLWLGDMPALLKGFLEQLARPGFAFTAEGNNPFGQRDLAGRSARIVATMGMPAMVYRGVFRAQSMGALERNILGFLGIAPVHETLVGNVDQLGDDGVAKWNRRMRALGGKAA